MLGANIGCADIPCIPTALRWRGGNGSEVRHCPPLPLAGVTRVLGVGVLRHAFCASSLRDTLHGAPAHAGPLAQGG
jgi:hypothetical protein